MHAGIQIGTEGTCFHTARLLFCSHPWTACSEPLVCDSGPSNAHPRVLAAQALPLLGHMHPPFLKIMDDVQVSNLGVSCVRV